MKAYPGLDAKYRDELTIAPFIHTLQDDVLKPAIQAATLTTLQKAIEVALACENGLSKRRQAKVRQIQDEEPHCGRERELEVLETIRALITGLERRIDKLEQTINKKLNEVANRSTASFAEDKRKDAEEE